MSITLKSGRGTVLTAAAAISFVSGILYIWSIVSKALVSEYNWTSTQASLPYTFTTIVFALSMVFAGRLQDRKGPRVCATAGGVLLGVGLILSGFAGSPLLMTLSFGVVVGSGIGIISASTTPPAVKWFPAANKGMVTGVVVAGIGFASVVYSPLINWLLASYGITHAFVSLGIGAMFLIVILAQLLKNPPEGYRADTNSSEEAGTVSKVSCKKEVIWSEMIRTTVFYRLWLMIKRFFHWKPTNIWRPPDKHFHELRRRTII